MLLNPTVIIEVLSPTTEAFDRGGKWSRYQMWLPELSDYILVSQSKPQIERFHRQPNGQWLYSLMNELEGNRQLTSVSCILQLTEVYDRLVFPLEEPEDLSEEQDSN